MMCNWLRVFVGFRRKPAYGVAKKNAVLRDRAYLFGKWRRFSAEWKMHQILLEPKIKVTRFCL